MEPCSYMLISGYFPYHSSKWHLTFLLYLIDSFNLTFNCILSRIENERVASNNKNREEKVMAFCGENTFCIRNSRLPPQKDCCTTQKYTGSFVQNYFQIDSINLVTFHWIFMIFVGFSNVIPFWLKNSKPNKQIIAPWACLLSLDTQDTF